MMYDEGCEDALPSEGEVMRARRRYRGLRRRAVDASVTRRSRAFLFRGPFLSPCEVQWRFSAMHCRLALDGQVEQDLVDLTPDQELLPAYRPHPLMRRT